MYIIELYIKVVYEVIKVVDFIVVLFGVILIGRDLVFRVFVRIYIGFIVDCIGFVVVEDIKLLLMIRFVFGGNIMVIIVCKDFRF